MLFKMRNNAIKIVIYLLNFCTETCFILGKSKQVEYSLSWFGNNVCSQSYLKFIFAEV